VKITFPSSIGSCPDMNSKLPVLIAGTYYPAGVGGFGSLIPNDSSFSSIKTMILNFSVILVFTIHFLRFGFCWLLYISKNLRRFVTWDAS